MKYLGNNRRKFIQQMITLSIAAGFYTCSSSTEELIDLVANNELPKRPFGKTGFEVGLFSLGGQATLEILEREDDAIQIINRALDLGVNYIDTSAYYGVSTSGQNQGSLQGTSERFIGKAIKDRRDEVFIATKTHDRTYDGAMRHLEKSLNNLQTNTIDLWQIHNIKAADRENIDRIFEPDGVLKAMQEVKEQGVVKHLGVTGHESPTQLKILIERFPFDVVLAAINAADKHHDPMIENLLPTAIEKNIGIVGMKVTARDRIFSNGGIVSMQQAMDYVLTLPVSTIIVGCDTVAELEENIRIAQNFSPLSEEEMIAIENLTKAHYKNLQYFKRI